MKLPDQLQDLLKRYGAALALASLALLIRALLAVKEGTSIYQLPIAAVVLSAWYGGRGPGLLTCLVSALGSLYLFIPPRYSFVLSPEYAVAFGIFLALCLLLSEFSAGRRLTEIALRTSEEKRRVSEARFRTLVDHATDAFFLSDDQSRVIDVNEAACQMLGYSREELIGKHPREFDVGLDDGSIARVAQRVIEGKTVTFETLHRRKDGTVFPVEIRGRGLEQAGRRLLLALVRDITERRLVEETLRGKDQALQIARTELARVSRLTTLGELTTSIAHEVSQPLGAMMASAGACARWLEADPPARAEALAALDNIVADGKRARDVIGRIRALTRRQVPRKNQLDINHEIVEVLALMKHEFSSHRIVLRTDLGPTPLNAAADRVQLQQVLLNLIVNAIEAMGAVHDRPRELTIVSRRNDPNGVLVEVRDCGTGLTAQRTEQVFEAFYTTKPEGIGIGLAISRSIVEAHGGRLWAAPNDPHGAVFRFSLPVTQSEAA